VEGVVRFRIRSINAFPKLPCVGGVFFAIIASVLKKLFLYFLFGNSRDDHGFSPLHWAAKYGQFKIAELLIQRGARVNVVNKGDDTPLHLAAAHGHHDVVRLVSLAFHF